MIATMLRRMLPLLVACGSSSTSTTEVTIDAAARAQDTCPPCPSGDICVARYDGTCHGGTECAPETVTGCETDATCSKACEDAYCNPRGGNIYSCMDESDCPSGNLRPPGVIACYGI
jgi:hypothetical protein